MIRGSMLFAARLGTKTRKNEDDCTSKTTMKLMYEWIVIIQQNTLLN